MIFKRKEPVITNAVFMHTVPTGTSLEKAILDGIRLAKKENMLVQFSFNGCKIRCHPKNTFKDVIRGCFHWIPSEIVVTKRTNDYHACLRGQPNTWGSGRTIPEAIGDLIQLHTEKLNFEVTLEL